MKKYIAPFILIVILVGGGAFYGGMAFAKSKTSFPNGFPGGAESVSGGPGGMGRTTGGMRSSGGFTGGEVLSVDDESVTVKLPDGGSKIIFFSDSTEISKSVVGTASDVAVGEQVMATGTTNTDGSITATTIQIRPTAVLDGLASE